MLPLQLDSPAPKSVRGSKGAKNNSKKTSLKKEDSNTTKASKGELIKSTGGRDSKLRTRRERPKKEANKNPYHHIMGQLPKEISQKLDWSKENLNDMCSSLTLPHEYKPGLVLKWLKKVSENEINKIQEEFLSIRLADRKIKRTISFSLKNYDNRKVSQTSNQSDTSSKIESERFSNSKIKATPNRIVNYNAAMVEDNSACSKTSSNTKASPNLVRIPLRTESNVLNCVQKTNRRLSFVNGQNEPRILSIIPGKSVVLQFKASAENSLED